jgi:hypothetical protein
MLIWTVKTEHPRYAKPQKNNNWYNKAIHMSNLLLPATKQINPITHTTDSSILLKKINKFKHKNITNNIKYTWKKNKIEKKLTYLNISLL